MRPVLETTPADLVGPIEFSIYGPGAAVHHVVPGMRFPGDHKGTIIVNGGSAVTPPDATSRHVGRSGQAAYAELLHVVLGEEGMQVSQLIIGGRVIEGDDEKDPAVLAEHLWNLHIKRDTFRQQISAD